MAGPIKVRIVGDSDGLRSSLNDAEGHVQGWAGRIGGHFTSLAGAVGKLAGGIALVGAGGAAAFLTDAIGKASDLGETQSKVNQIFGEAGAGLDAWASTAAKTMGQSKQAALDAAANFGIFGKAAGLTGNDLTGFSTGLSALAGDLASFGNTSPEEAAEALGAALRGEAEPMRKFGVLLDDATLKAKAMEMGIFDGTGSLTQQQKILAAHASILTQTKDAQGDFARTSGGLANQQRILKAQLGNVSAELGAKLLPFAVKVATKLNEMVPVVARIGSALMDKLGPPLKAVATAISMFVYSLRSGFTEDEGTKVEGVALKIRAALLKIVEGARAVIDWVRDHWPQITGVIGSVVDGIKWAIDNIFVPAVQGIIAAAKWAIDFIKDHWPEIRATFEEAFDAIKDRYDRVYKPIIEAVIEGAKLAVDWIKDHWPEIQKVISAVFDAILWTVRNVLIPVFELQTEIMARVVDWVRDHWPQIQAVFRRVADDVKWAWDNVLRPSFDAIVEVAGLVVSSIRKIVEIGADVANIGRKILDGLVDARGTLGSAGDLFWGVGADIIQGLWDGIAAKWNSVVQWLKDAAGALPDIVKRVLGIQSPSKVFMALGEHVGDGFRLGIERAWPTNLPTLAAATAGPAAAGALRGSHGGAQQAGSPTIIVNVSGVVGDERAVAARVTDLLRQYARSTSGRAA